MNVQNPLSPLRPARRTRPLLINEHDYSTAVILAGCADPVDRHFTLAADTLGGGGGGRCAVCSIPTAAVDRRSPADGYSTWRRAPNSSRAMGARSWPGYALRTLVGDETLLASLLEVLGTVSSTT